MKTAEMMRALILASAMMAGVLGCGSKTGRSLLSIDIQADAELVGIYSVQVRVTHDARDVATQSFEWKPAPGEPLRVGLYLPDSVDGTVSVDAVAYDLQGNPIGSSDQQSATVHAGQAASVVTLHLVPGGVVATDGGNSDASDDRPAHADGATGVDSGRDVASVDAATGADAGAGLDATPADANTVDVAGDAPAPDTAALNWSTAENIENDVIAPSYVPKVAIDPVEGHLLVAWQEDTAVKSRRYDATTHAWGEIKTLDDRGKVYGVQVGTGANGRATVVWYHNGTGTAELEGLWAAHSKDGGSTWSAPIQVHMGPVYFDVALAVSRDGDARVAWQESAMNMNVLWSAYYPYAAGTWTGAAAVKTSADPNERYPEMVMDKRGTGLLAWNQRDDGGEDSIWGASFGLNEALKAPVLLDSYTTDSAYDAAVAISPDGSHGLAMWGQRNGSDSADLWMNEFTGATGWKGPQKVLTAGWVSSPAVAIDAANTATVVWTQPLASGKWNLVSARRLDGQSWSATTAIETTNQATGRTDEDPVAHLLADGQGNLHLAWRRRTSATAQLFGVFTRRYAAGAWQAEQTIGSKTALPTYEPDLAVAEDGRAAITFYYLDPDGTANPDAFNVFVSLYR